VMNAYQVRIYVLSSSIVLDTYLILTFFIGYYGDALAPGKGDCKRCQCHPLGTLEYENGELNCDQLSGQCKCKPHVVSTNCDQCEPGFYDLNSGQVRACYKVV